MRARKESRSYWIGGAALLAAWTVTAAPAAAQAPNDPISVSVGSSLAGEKGLGRIFSSASRGDVDDTARDVDRLLGRTRWARIVSGDAEVVVTIDSRERVERRRTTDKDGKVSIEHRYRAEGTVDMGRRRLQVRAEQDFTEAEYSTRNDSDQFQKVAEKLVTEISNVVLSDLDELRPDRAEAGFDHAAKYKLLFKGDGLEVKGVAPGSPAEQAGLQIKDRIRRIDDEKGTDQMDYRVRTWWLESAGTRVTLEVERNKVRQTMQLTLMPRRDWGGAPVAASAATTAAPPPAAGGTRANASVELKPGMTELEVVRLLGQPLEKVAFGAKSLWRYDRYSLTFQNGRVVDMK